MSALSSPPPLLLLLLLLAHSLFSVPIYSS